MKKENKDTIIINPLRLAKEVKPEQLLKKLHSFEGRLAGFITYFSGSMMFVYLHIIVIFVFFTYKPFEDQIFNIALSIEAIFLATFIMISQNRQALVDTYRELEDEQEQEEEEAQKEELEEEFEDIQKDLDDIKNAISFINQKVQSVEKAKGAMESGNGNGAEQK